MNGGELRIHGDGDGVVFELRGPVDAGVVEAMDAAAEVARDAHQHVTVDVSRLAPTEAAEAAVASFVRTWTDEVTVTGDGGVTDP